MVPELDVAAADRLYRRLAAVWGSAPVLDVGAGVGAVSAELVARGVRLLLTDVVDWRAGVARGLPFVRADAAALPVRTGGCGGVHVARVLAHLPDWRAALAECVRVLAPGGVLALWLGSPLFHGEVRALLDVFYGRAGVELAPVHHPPTPEAVADALAGHGLTRVEVVEERGTVWATPRQAVTDAATIRHRYAPGQDLSGLPAVAEAVLAASPVPADVPVPQPRVVRYWLYR